MHPKRRLTWALGAITLTAFLDSTFVSAENFTPESLKIPFTEINIRGPAGGANLYSCQVVDDWIRENRRRDSQGGSATYIVEPPTDPRFYASCLVDLMDDADIENKFGSRVANVGAGSYNRIYVNRCTFGNDFFYIKGKVNISGRTWYTQAGPDPFTTTAERYGEAFLENSGSCIRLTEWARPIEVYENRESAIDLVIIPTNMAIATTTPINGVSCTARGNQSGLSLCVNGGIDFFGVDPSLLVSLESYLISPVTGTTGSHSIGQIDILSAGNTKIGATGKVNVGSEAYSPYFNDKSWNEFGAQILVFRTVPDGTYDIIWNKFDDSTPEDTYIMRIPRFTTQNHEGLLELYDFKIPYSSRRMVPAE